MLPVFPIMAVPVRFARSTHVSQRRLILSALIVSLIIVVHYLDAVPSTSVFTSTRIHAINRLGSQPENHVQTSCRPGFLKHLKNLELSPNITYSRKYIKPTFPDGVDRDMITNISLPLLTNTTNFNLRDPDACSIYRSASPYEPIELPVPRPGPLNEGQYGHLIFGVATTSKRLDESMHTFAHWLKDSGATLVALLVDEPEALRALNFTDLEQDYQTTGYKIKLVTKHHVTHTTEQSHMLLIDDMLTHANATGLEPHWLGVLDDDTFFPSLHELSAALAQHDHTRPRYLGQLTENAALLGLGVLSAFGGAGIFLSAALARDLQPHLDACRGDVGGDTQIMHCVHRHSAARLTRVDGLWQCDLPGDPSGFYESGRRVLSMHHWKSWNQLPAREMAAVTNVCGDCFLQRFVFASNLDGEYSHGDEETMMTIMTTTKTTTTTTVLNNGYSINVYGAGVALPDLSRTEQTWDDWARDPWEDYEWSLGPLREEMSEDEKKSYYLETVITGEEGGLTQVYVHRAWEENENDEVIELVWQPS